MRPGRAAVAAASLASAALSAHSLVNLRRLRAAPDLPGTGRAPGMDLRVTVLIPARDEAHRIGPCLESLRVQRHPGLRVLVLDDGSSDATADVVLRAGAVDPRLSLLTGGDDPLPPGWLGKPWACHRLADAALADDEPDLLLFLDADVVLAPDAVARVAALMATTPLALACPYPRQVAVTAAERLIQPLLQWSWLTTLPLGLAERSPRPSLTAANGQVVAVRTAAYRSIGGHGCVRDKVLEDIALARAIKAAGGRAGVTDGTQLASCRMYEGAGAVVDGYAKSLWSAFGSPVGALAVAAGLTALYVLPPVAAVTAPTRATRALGCAGYLAAVAGRVAVARRTGQRVPDSLGHPMSILALDALVGVSWWRRHRGTLAWKGRALPTLPDRAAGATGAPR